jgi:small-conductance mechanosensitive channel
MKQAIRILLLLVIGFSPEIATGQARTDVDPEEAGVQPNIAPVKVDGKVLFYVSGISSYPPEFRASTISKRIREAAKNKSILNDSVKIIKTGDFLKVYAGKDFIMNIYKTDAETEGVDINILADIIQGKIRETIKVYRADRSREVVLREIFFAIGSAGLFIVAIFLLSWLTAWMNRIITRRLKASVDLLENRSQKLISSVQLWKLINILFRTIKLIIIILLSLAFTGYILGLFPWTNNFAVSALRVFLKPVGDIGRAILNYLPSLVFLIFIILITRYLLKLVKMLFEGIGKGSVVINNFYPEWAMPTFKIVRTAIIAFALILAFPYIPGSGSPAFKGISVFIGILFSLGSTSFISNIIAGYSMTYRRAFKIGDLIEVGTQTGFVEEQKLLVTRIRSYKNEEIVIPNSLLLNSNILNYNAKTNENGLIIHSTVGIGYETPWRQVDAMLKLAADKTEGVSKDPAPFVLKRSLGDFAINYEINVYVKDIKRILELYNELHQNILDVFNENNVQIMTPAYRGDPEIPKVVPKDQWDLPLANEK